MPNPSSTDGFITLEVKDLPGIPTVATIDSRGRAWKATDHPRDMRGRFIETGGKAREWGGKLVRVVRSLGSNRFEVADDKTGATHVSTANRLVMTQHADGTSYTNHDRKVPKGFNPAKEIADDADAPDYVKPVDSPRVERPGAPKPATAAAAPQSSPKQQATQHWRDLVDEAGGDRQKASVAAKAAAKDLYTEADDLERRGRSDLAAARTQAAMELERLADARPAPRGNHVTIRHADGSVEEVVGHVGLGTVGEVHKDGSVKDLPLRSDDKVVIGEEVADPNSDLTRDDVAQHRAALTQLPDDELAAEAGNPDADKHTQRLAREEQEHRAGTPIAQTEAARRFEPAADERDTTPRLNTTRPDRAAAPALDAEPGKKAPAMSAQQSQALRTMTDHQVTRQQGRALDKVRTGQPVTAQERAHVADAIDQHVEDALPETAKEREHLKHLGSYSKKLRGAPAVTPTRQTVPERSSDTAPERSSSERVRPDSDAVVAAEPPAGVREPEQPGDVLRGPRGAGDGRGDRRDGERTTDPAEDVEQRGAESARAGGPQGGGGAGDAEPRVRAGAGGSGGQRGGVARRFTPKTQNDLAPSGEKAKLAANLTALRTLRKIQAEDRPATAAEQRVLARWAGWGALPKVFDPKDTKYASERAELQELLGEKEWAAARTNMLNAHYTDAGLVDDVWAGLQEMGFTGGDVLEPGSGSGNFIGKAPDTARMTGVEQDPITAGISKLLYPDADIHQESFARSPFNDDVFDAVVGNVPFGQFALSDKRHNKGNHSIHNHFIIKSLAATKPGGVAAVISSAFTLDAQGEAARREIAEHSDLIGAVRLPNGSHKETAGTDVVTDVLLFRKRKPGEKPGNMDWLKISGATHPDGSPVLGITRGDKDRTHQGINDYFRDHPENVLGTIEDGGYNGLAIRSNGDTRAQLREALSRIATDAKAQGRGWDPIVEGEGLRRAKRSLGSDREGRVEFSHDEVVGKDRKGNSKYHPHFTTIEDGRKVPFAVEKSAAHEVQQLVGLRDLASSLLALEADVKDDTDSDLIAHRARLNKAYDDYAAKYGPITRRDVTEKEEVNDETGEVETKITYRLPTATRRMMQDEGSSELFALEHNYDPGTNTAKKADIFNRRQVGLDRDIAEHTDDPGDAVALVAERGEPLTYASLAQVMKLRPAQAQAATKGLVFRDHTNPAVLVARAEYLSGNVRAKLAEAEAAAINDPSLKENVDALREVKPADAELADVPLKLGSSWIKPDVVQAFARDLMRNQDVQVTHDPYEGWKAPTPKAGYGRNDYLENTQWGTERNSFYDLLGRVLKQQHHVISVYDTVTDEDGNKSRVYNKKASEEAVAKAGDIESEFTDWVWRDAARAQKMLNQYNETFRALVPRSYDGSARRALPGMVEGTTLMPHQNAAVTRAVSEPSVLFEHVVGAGKTYELAASAMELKRLGLVNKPVLAVPGHMLAQWTAEFKELYPQARILAADSEDLTKGGRKRFAARARNSDWDIVLLTHEAFESIPVSLEAHQEYLSGELRRLEDQQRRADDSKTEKQIQKNIETAKKKLEDALDKRKDDGGVTFESIGFDYVMADEAHVFKNLPFVTRMQGVTSPDGSGRALDMHMKLELLRKQKADQGSKARIAAFATGTPISNSLAEMFTMNRFLRPDLLEEAGVSDFDSWSATFAAVSAKLEQDTSGTGWVERVRFRGFNDSLGDALRMWRTFADTKTIKDLDYIKRPSIKGGKRQIHAVERSEAQAAALQSFQVRLAAMPRRKQKGDDTPVAVIGDGRRSAVDPRLMSERGRSWAGVGQADDFDSPKLDSMADNIADIWARTKDNRYKVDHKSDVDADLPGALQMVMTDTSAPGDGLNAYDMLKERLVARGMDPSRIRYVQEAAGSAEKKAKLFEDARQGKVDVIIGGTQNLGTGTNVQNRLYALHHMDGDWKPSSIEQREGRILRQGNQHDEVELHVYVTERTHDVKTWDMIAYKQAGLDSIQNGSYDLRAVEFNDDVDPLTDFDTITGISSGDPLVQDRRDVAADLKKLEAASAAHRRQQLHTQSVVDQAKRQVNQIDRNVETLTDAREQTTSTLGDAFSLRDRERGYQTRKDAAAGFGGQLEVIFNDSSRYGMQERSLGSLGRLGGLYMLGSYRLDKGKKQITISFSRRENSWQGGDLPLEPVIVTADQVTTEAGRLGVISRLENRVNGVDDRIAAFMELRDETTDRLGQAAADLGKPFRRAEELDDVRKRYNLLNSILAAKDSEGGELVEAEVNARRSEYQKLADTAKRKDQAEKNARLARQAATSRPKADTSPLRTPGQEPSAEDTSTPAEPSVTPDERAAAGDTVELDPADVTTDMESIGATPPPAAGTGDDTDTADAESVESDAPVVDGPVLDAAPAVADTEDAAPDTVTVAPEDLPTIDDAPVATPKAPAVGDAPPVENAPAVDGPDNVPAPAASRPRPSGTSGGSDTTGETVTAPDVRGPRAESTPTRPTDRPARPRAETGADDRGGRGRRRNRPNLPDTDGAGGADGGAGDLGGANSGEPNLPRVPSVPNSPAPTGEGVPADDGGVDVPDRGTSIPDVPGVDVPTITQPADVTPSSDTTDVPDAPGVDTDTAVDDVNVPTSTDGDAPGSATPTFTAPTVQPVREQPADVPEPSPVVGGAVGTSESAPDADAVAPKQSLAAEANEPATPTVPAAGKLGDDLSFEDHGHGTTLDGPGTYPNREAIKAAGFRWREMPSGPKDRYGNPAKRWTAEGTPKQRAEKLAKLRDALGVPEDGGDVVEEYPPTPEQQDVIDGVLTGEDTVVRALAGTGKTSTLQMIARRFAKQDPKKRIAYIAFNKSIQVEATKKMPGNVEARTGDSIAFVSMPQGLKDKYGDRTSLRRNADVAEHLGLTRDLPVGDEAPEMTPEEQAAAVIKAIENYSISADDDLAAKHLPERARPAAAALLPAARKAWGDLKSPRGRLRITNSHMTKMWALSRPDLSRDGSGLRRPADVVFFDEAQDINPVMAKVIADQGIQKVYVGDSNQAIYAFRGAVDELDNVRAAHDLPLTKSWRFGPEVAEVGNRFLQLLGAQHRVEGGGAASSVVPARSMDDPDAILVRSNAGMIEGVLGAQEAEKLVGVPKGTKSDLRKLVDTAAWLQGGRMPAQVHDDLAAYRTWDEVKREADKGDDPKIVMLHRIVEQNGVDGLDSIVSKLVEGDETGPNGETPDIVVTTAHKSKGLEWDRVKIGDDFRGPKQAEGDDEPTMPDPEELRLAYVAVTRAKGTLDPGSLAWVFEHTNPNGGEPGAAAQATPDAPAVDAVDAPNVVDARASEGQIAGQTRIEGGERDLTADDNFMLTEEEPEPARPDASGPSDDQGDLFDEPAVTEPTDTVDEPAGADEDAPDFTPDALDALSDEDLAARFQQAIDTDNPDNIDAVLDAQDRRADTEPAPAPADALDAAGVTEEPPATPEAVQAEEDAVLAAISAPITGGAPTTAPDGDGWGNYAETLTQNVRGQRAGERTRERRQREVRELNKAAINAALVKHWAENGGSETTEDIGTLEGRLGQQNFRKVVNGTALPGATWADKLSEEDTVGLFGMTRPEMRQAGTGRAAWIRFPGTITLDEHSQAEDRDEDNAGAAGQGAAEDRAGSVASPTGDAPVTDVGTPATGGPFEPAPRARVGAGETPPPAQAPPAPDAPPKAKKPVFDDAPDRPAPPVGAPPAEPAPIAGSTAEWVTAGELTVGNIARVDGVDSTGAPASQSGFVLTDAIPVTVTRPGGDPETMVAFTIADYADGTGARGTVYAAPSAIAARVPDQQAGAEGPKSIAELDVLNGRLPDQLPRSGDGHGLFPGTAVSDGRREGIVTQVRADGVTVQYDGGRSEDVAGGSLRVLGENRPAGWTSDGRRIETGQVVEGDFGRGTVEAVSGDTVTVAAPSGMRDVDGGKVRVVGHVTGDGARTGTAPSVASMERTPAGDLEPGQTVMLRGAGGDFFAAKVTRTRAGDDRVAVTYTDTRDGSTGVRDFGVDELLPSVDGDVPDLDAPATGMEVELFRPMPLAPISGPSTDVALYPSQRDVVTGLGFDMTGEKRTSLAQAAARVRAGQPLSRRQAEALATALEGAAAGADETRARWLRRVASRLRGQQPVPVDGPVTPTPSTAELLAPGDLIALPSGDGSTVGKVVEVRPVAGGLLRQVTLDTDSGHTTNVVPAGTPVYRFPDVGDPVDEADAPDVPDIIDGEVISDVPDDVRVRADQTAAAITQHAVTGFADGDSLAQMREQVAERLTDEEIASVRARIRAQFPVVDHDDTEAAAAAQQTRQAIIDTINGLEQMPGESLEDAKARGLDLAIAAGAQVVRDQQAARSKAAAGGNVGAPNMPAGSRRSAESAAAANAGTPQAGQRYVQEQLGGDVDALVDTVTGEIIDAVPNGTLTDTSAATASRAVRRAAAKRDATTTRRVADRINGGRPAPEGLLQRVGALLRLIAEGFAKVVERILARWRRSDARRAAAAAIERARLGMRTWTPYRDLMNLVNGGQLDRVAGEGESLTERDAFFGRFAPEPGRFGQRSVIGAFVGAPSPTDLAAGRPGTSSVESRWVADVLPDGGPGVTTLGHLAAMRGAGRAVEDTAGTRQEPVADVLGDVRDLGRGDGPGLPLSGQAGAVAALRDAEALFPRDWIGQVSGPIRVTYGDRTAFDPATGVATIMQGDTTDKAAAALRVLSQVMESSIPDLRAATTAYHQQRTSAGAPGARTRRGRNRLTSLADRFPTAGLGRDDVTRQGTYPNPWMGRELPDGSAPEVLPQAVTDLFGGTDIADADSRRFALGLFARPRATERRHPLTVTGSLEGAVYRVKVTGDKAAPVTGSGPVSALVAEWVGKKVLVTPAGPKVTVDPTDEQSVLALLGARTAILSVSAE